MDKDQIGVRTKKEQRAQLWRKIKQNKEAYLMLAPFMIVFVIFTIIPVIMSLPIGLTDFDMVRYPPTWVGLSNFKYLFATSDAYVITRNTILFNLAFIVVNTVLSIAVAIILSELKKKIKNFYQSVILLPHLISAVIISYIVFAFLSTESGFLNNTMRRLFGTEPIAWYAEKQYWPFILIFVSAWKSVGYQCIIYLATLLGFDRSFYEAADLDGATVWQQIRLITLPLLRPTVIMLTMMAVGRIFYSDFGLFYQVPQNSGALFPVTNTIDTYVYRGLLEAGNISMSAAAGFYQSIVGFILVLGANLLVRKYDSDSALF